MFQFLYSRINILQFLYSRINIFQFLYSRINIFQFLYSRINIFLFLYSRINIFQFLYSRINIFQFLYSRINIFQFLYSRINIFQFLYSQDQYTSGTHGTQKFGFRWIQGRFVEASFPADAFLGSSLSRFISILLHRPIFRIFRPVSWTYSLVFPAPLAINPYLQSSISDLLATDPSSNLTSRISALQTYIRLNRSVFCICGAVSRLHGPIS